MPSNPKADLSLMPLVITACSRRKRVHPVARASDLPTGTVDEVGRAWLDVLEANTTRSAASQLYCGRSVRAAEKAADALGGHLLFASAGLGWVGSDCSIPSYGMTIVDGEDSVLRRVSGKFSAAEWWSWLNQHSVFATSLASAVGAEESIILVALPRAYLAMVADELLHLPAPVRARLRIIQRAGAAITVLLPWTLAYDDRLEGLDGYAGTRSDFATRAAIHFAVHVWPEFEHGTIEAQNGAVEAALSKCLPRVTPIGARRSDDQLRTIINHHWNATGGRTTRLLRLFRDELGIACEQGRFARLAKQVRQEREQAA